MTSNTKPLKGRSGVQGDGTPPRESLFRAIQPGGVEVRSADDGGMPTLTGHFSVFNEWTEINSLREGQFLERIAPGAFTKTFAEGRDRMRVLFQHGKDPQVGDKPLGPISDLREDDTGAYYEVPLLDTSYNRDLLPGLQAGLYGASFRFGVMREDVNKRPERSSFNPEGLPERTIREARVLEFGPVTFPAYAGATSGVRSMTDEFTIAPFAADPKHLARMLAFARFDNEDIGTLAQMIALATEFIDEQDETDDQDCITQMEGVVSALTMLMQGEVDETEPDEPGEDESASANTAPSQSDAASDGTSGRSAATIPSELLWFAKEKAKGVSHAQA